MSNLKPAPAASGGGFPPAARSESPSGGGFAPAARSESPSDGAFAPGPFEQLVAVAQGLPAGWRLEATADTVLLAWTR